ncbi:MAG: PilZ domain-containing protein [Burkholderiales bacterium]
MTDPLDTPAPKAAAPTKPAPGADMRASTRRVVSLKARVLLPGGKMMEGRTHDLSTGGVGLLLRAPLAPQSAVQVAVQLPKPKMPGQYEVITGSGKVVFQVLKGDDYQIGVQWLSLDSKVLTLLQAFTEHATKPRPS